jgi:hypothetical protein
MLSHRGVGCSRESGLVEVCMCVVLLNYYFTQLYEEEIEENQQLLQLLYNFFTTFLQLFYNFSYNFLTTFCNFFTVGDFIRL